MVHKEEINEFGLQTSREHIEAILEIYELVNFIVLVHDIRRAELETLLHPSGRM